MSGHSSHLVCRVGARYCALPIEHVCETMRPLGVEPIRRAPPYVLGASVVRSKNVPVVSMSALLGCQDADAVHGRARLRPRGRGLLPAHGPGRRWRERPMRWSCDSTEGDRFRDEIARLIGLAFDDGKRALLSEGLLRGAASPARQQGPGEPDRGVFARAAD